MYLSELIPFYFHSSTFPGQKLVGEVNSFKYTRFFSPTTSQHYFYYFSITVIVVIPYLNLPLCPVGECWWLCLWSDPSAESLNLDTKLQYISLFYQCCYYYSTVYFSLSPVCVCCYYTLCHPPSSQPTIYRGCGVYAVGADTLSPRMVVVASRGFGSLLFV